MAARQKEKDKVVCSRQCHPADAGGILRKKEQTTNTAHNAPMTKTMNSKNLYFTPDFRKKIVVLINFFVKFLKF